MNMKQPITQSLGFNRKSIPEMLTRSVELRDAMLTRRSVRSFADEPIPEAVLRDCIEIAANAPSGANLQPWSFVLVTDPAKKAEIRAAAEKEERAFYNGRASKQWLEDLEFIDLGPQKPFLETAPALIAVFSHPTREGGETNYYVKESVGIAVGFLISALHQCGLATLTHTPSPMKFLGQILDRPANERPYLLLPVGYPSDDATVPALERRPLDKTLTRF